MAGRSISLNIKYFGIDGGGHCYAPFTDPTSIKVFNILTLRIYIFTDIRIFDTAEGSIFVLSSKYIKFSSYHDKARLAKHK